MDRAAFTRNTLRDFVSHSGTRSAYLYSTLSARDYLPKTARVQNWGTAGFIASTVCYAGLYALWSLTGLLAATVCTSAMALLSALSLPRESCPPPAAQPRPAAGLARGLLGGKALFLMAAFSAVSIGQILINFFYAGKLIECGLPETWMTLVILGYSAVQMLSVRLLARLRAGSYPRALAVYFALSGLGLAALGLTARPVPALLLRLALPLLLQVPVCILDLFENELIDALGGEERRAELLSVFQMSASVFEIVFLLGSAAVSQIGAAACFGAAGALLAVVGALAGRALRKE